jgi:hypothetical protein
MTNLFEKDLDKFRKNPGIAAMLKNSKSILLGRDEFMDWMFGRHDTRNKQANKDYDQPRIHQVSKALKARCEHIGMDYTQARIKLALEKEKKLDIIVMVDLLGYSNATKIKSIYSNKLVIGTRVKATNDEQNMYDEDGNSLEQEWTKGTVVRMENGIPFIKEDNDIGQIRKFKYWKQTKKETVGKRRVMTSFIQQKMLFVQGFLVSELGECSKFPNVYSVSIVCVGKVAAMKVVQGTLQPGVGSESSTKGSILVGAFLYCVKGSDNNEMAILELADSYTNIPGYFAYTKVGFDPDCVLFQHSCYEQTDLLPMTANLTAISQSDITGYITGSHPRNTIHDPFHFYRLASIDKGTQAKMAKYLEKVVIYYRLASLTKLKIPFKLKARMKERTLQDYLEAFETNKTAYEEEYNKHGLPTLNLLPGLNVFRSTILEDKLPEIDLIESSKRLSLTHRPRGSRSSSSRQSWNGSSSIHSVQRNSNNRSIRSVERNSNNRSIRSVERNSNNESNNPPAVFNRSHKLAMLNQTRNVGYI